MNSKTFLIDQKDKKVLLVFDAVIDINKRLTNKTPKFPVGKGEEVTDNVVNGQDVITIRGIVSDAHPRVEFGLKGGESDDNLVISFIKDLAVVKQFTDLGNRLANTTRERPELDKTIDDMISEGTDKLSASVAEARIKAAALSKRLFVVEEGGNRFENLLFESLVITRDNTSHRVLKFTAVLKQVRFVAFAEAQISVKPVIGKDAIDPKVGIGKSKTVRELVGLGRAGSDREGSTSAERTVSVAKDGVGLGRGGR